MPANYIIEEHQHLWGQLAYSSQGIMKVEIPGASFIIPPERALWLPPHTPHCVSTTFGMSFRSLYIENKYSNRLPAETTAININKLLRELILATSLWAENYELTSKKKRHIQFLLDQIEEANSAQLSLKMPKDKRLKKITDVICNDPSNNKTLEHWSKMVGATPRTINRLFHKETLMGFVEWRQHLRILFSLERIENGEKISSLALDLGYQSASAFITMFKKHLGVSPKHYFKTSSFQSKEKTFSSPESSV